MHVGCETIQTKPNSLHYCVAGAQFAGAFNGHKDYLGKVNQSPTLAD